MTVGELTGFIDLEDKGFASELRSAGQGLSRLQSTTSSATSSIESTVTKSFSEIEKAIADGLDPTAAIADLDRLEKELDAGLADMLAEADRAAAELDAEIGDAFDRLDDGARESGRRAGKELSDGLETGLQDAERAARESGEDAGREFGDGVESSSGGAGGGGRMSGIASSFIGALKAAPWLAAGAAIGNLISDGIAGAMDAEKAKAKLNAQIGAFGPQGKKYGKIVGELYAQGFGEGMGDVADAVKSVVHNLGGIGKASKENVGQISKDGLIAAQVLDTDVSEATRAAGQLVKTGLAKDWKDAFDQIIAMTQKGGDASDDLLDTLTEYSTQFREVGISGPKAFGLLSQASLAGARDLDTAADAIKEFAIRSKDGSSTSKQAFQAIGLNANEMFKTFAAGGPKADKAMTDVIARIKAMEDPVKQNAVVTALFGTKAEDLQDALFALDPTKATQVLGDFAGATKKAGDELGSTADAKLTAFKRGLEQNVVNYIGGTVLPKLEELGDGLAMSDLPAQLEESKQAVLDFFDGILGKVEEWASGNEVQLSALKDTFDEYFGSIKTTVTEVLDAIEAFWGEWGDEILTTVTIALDAILSSIGGFITVIGGIFKTAKSLLTGDWQGVWDGLGEIVEGGTRGIRSIADSGMRLLGEAMGFNWDDIKARGKKGIDDLVANVKALPSNLKSIAAQAGQWLLQAGRDLIQGMINGVKEKATELANAARGVVQSAVDGAKNLLGIHSPSTVFAEIGHWTVKGLIQGLEAENGNVKSTVEKMVDTVKKAFKSQPDVADGLIDFIKVGNTSLEALAKKRQELVEKLAAAKEMAKQVAGSAEEWAAITGLKAEDITGAGDMAAELTNKASAINNFANNIKTLAARGLNKKIIQDIIDAGVEKGATFAEMLVGSDGSEIKALNKAQAAVDKASKKLGKASADAMYDVGKKSGEGYLKGLEDSLKKLDKEMEKIAKALINAIKKALKIKSPSQELADVGVMTMEGLNVGMSSMLGSVISTAQAIIGQAVAAAKKTAGTGGVGGMVAGSLPGDGYLSPGSSKALVIDESQIATLPGVAYSGTPATPAASPAAGGVTVNIENATVTQESDFAKLGAQFGFEYMAHA
ncbi:phage tail tape measure protein [Nonomuraea sp. NPDC026600]|uniref:phage tail tape measure protein n=1 Tax=Nonomuraea sp. NPDC026600 TaxID=3155363 RepID=UPI003411BD7C